MDSETIKILTIKIKGMLYGVLGAFAGIIPNLFLKSIPIIFFPDIFNLYRFYIPILGIEVTNFGIVSVLGYGSSFLGIVFPLVVGGALFGLIGTNLFLEYRSLKIKKRKGSFWWSFFGGMLFNLIFIFYIPVIAS